MGATRSASGRELICDACGSVARAGAKFCGSCGREMASEFVCAKCGRANSAANRFCGYCGHRRAVPAVPDIAVPDVPDGGGAPVAHTHTPPPRLRMPSLPMAAVGGALAPASAAIMAGGALLTLAAHIALTRYDGGDAPALMTLALAVGIGVFALGVFANPVARRLPDPLAGVALRLPRVNLRSPGRLVALAVGAGALALLSARMLAGQTGAINLPLWYVALGGFLALFVPTPRLPRVSKARMLDAAIALGLAAAFIALNARDLNYWYYSALGDEYAFYSFATEILQGGVLRPFSQEGVYNSHPYMSSLHQAAFMRLFEGSNFWWRFSSVFIGALAIPAVYIAGYVLHGRRAAIIAALLLMCSHYVFGITHHGDNRTESLAITTWAIALFALGMRRGSPPLLYAAGVAAGYGFYTFYAGRLAGPVILLFALTLLAPRDLRRLWPAALGAVAAALPTLLLEREALFTRMLGQVAGGYDANITGPLGERVVGNIVNNGAAFSHNPVVHTYVSGALLDPISAYIAALGVGFALGRLGHPSARLALIWFAVGFVALGALNPHSSVAVTRMYSALPPLLLMGGAVAAHLIDRLPARALSGAARTGGVAALIGLAAVAVLALNARQFWVETPKVYHNTQEALAMGALQSGACAGEPGDALIVGENTESLLRWALRGRYFGEELPYLVEHRALQEDVRVPIEGIGCAIFLQPDAEAARRVKGELRARYPAWEFSGFSGVSGKSEVEVFAPVGR